MNEHDYIYANEFSEYISMKEYEDYYYPKKECPLKVTGGVPFISDNCKIIPNFKENICKNLQNVDEIEGLPQIIDENRVKIGDKIYFLWQDISEIKFAKLSEFAVTPTRKHSTDAGLDFYATTNMIDIYIQPGEFHLFYTQIAIEIPKSYMLKLFEKSKGTSILGGGVIDTYYEPGEIIVKLYNTTNDIMKFKAGQAICQGVYEPIATPKLKQVSVEELENNSPRSKQGGIHNM